MSHYEILGVTRDSTFGEIKAAYRKLAQQWHPDKHNGSLEANAKFQAIQKAFEILSDQDKRQRYDRGETVSPNERTAHDSAREFLVQVFSHLVKSTQPQAVDVVNLAEHLQSFLLGEIQKGNQIVRQQFLELHKLRNVQRRLKHPSGILIESLKQQRRHLHNEIRSNKIQRKMVALALEMAEEYEYETDPSPAQQFYVYSSYTGTGR